jgi:hypothetical protein
MIRDAGVIGKSAYPTGTDLGLGYSFAKEILASGAVDGPVGLVPCAFGGSALSRWEKQPGLADAWEGDARNIPGSGEANGKIDGDLYARMARRTKLALKQRDAVLRGVLFHQGESDTNTIELAESYASRLTALIADVRAEFDSPELPFLIGELGHWLRSAAGPNLTDPACRGSLDPKDATDTNAPGRTFHRIVTAQMRQVAESVPHCLLVSAAGLQERGDHVHWSTEGFVQFGARYAAQWLRLQPAVQ